MSVPNLFLIKESPPHTPLASHWKRKASLWALPRESSGLIPPQDAHEHEPWPPPRTFSSLSLGRPSRLRCPTSSAATKKLRNTTLLWHVISYTQLSHCTVCRHLPVGILQLKEGLIVIAITSIIPFATFR